MRFANRPVILQVVPKNPRDSWPAWTDTPVELGPVVPEPAALDPRWRSLASTIRDEELERLDGYGPRPLEALVRLTHERHRADLADALAHGENLVEFVAASGDVVVWDAGRVVAVLRVLPDGSLEDSRFNRSGFLIDPCDSVEKGGDL